AFYELLGAVDGDGEVLGKPEIAHAVNYAEIDRFGVPSLRGRDLALRDAEDLGRGERVDVLRIVVRLDEFLGAAEMCEHPKLYLGIVRRDQHTPLGRDERALDIPCLLPSRGDVLQIGIGGG